MSQNTAGISRRDVIKKGALAGGLVWAAPMVTKVSPAAAWHTSPFCECHTEGQTLYRAHYTVTNNGIVTNSCVAEPVATACDPACWTTVPPAPCAGPLQIATAAHSGGGNTRTFRISFTAGLSVDIVGNTHVTDAGGCFNDGVAGLANTYYEWPHPAGGGTHTFRLIFCAA